jgi:hypothetical protein
MLNCQYNRQRGYSVCSYRGSSLCSTVLRWQGGGIFARSTYPSAPEDNHSQAAAVVSTGAAAYRVDIIGTSICAHPGCESPRR